MRMFFLLNCQAGFLIFDWDVLILIGLHYPGCQALYTMTSWNGNACHITVLFVKEIQRWPVVSPHKPTVMGSFDVLLCSAPDRAVKYIVNVLWWFCLWYCNVKHTHVISWNYLGRHALQTHKMCQGHQSQGEHRFTETERSILTLTVRNPKCVLNAWTSLLKQHFLALNT